MPILRVLRSLRTDAVVKRTDYLQTACALKVGAKATTAASAASNASGNFFPRFSARRRIPAHAFALKKNRCGTTPVSKVSDNEHTTASLGHSEVLSVQHSVCEPVPELPQRPEDGTKIPSSSA